MKGARPLTATEIRSVSKQFDGKFEIRNRSLLMLGISVGGRISELLALKIGDVWQNDRPVADLLFRRETVKGKESSRMVPVNRDGQNAIADLVAWHKAKYGSVDHDRPLFASRKQSGMKPISRGQAHKVLETAFNSADLNGKLATHSLRKTFAQRIYDVTGDIFAVKELLGHKSVETTRLYIGVGYEKLQKACKSIEISGETDRTSILYHSIDEIDTEKLIVELMKRGLDMSSTVRRVNVNEVPTLNSNERLVSHLDFNRTSNGNGRKVT